MLFMIRNQVPKQTVRETNLFNSVCKARLVGGEWHLMNQGNVMIVQLGHHVQQYLCAGCNHNDIRTLLQHTVWAYKRQSSVR